MSFGGISNDLQYVEFELDSLDNSGSNNAAASGTDWPKFLIGGKRPLTDIAGVKIIEAQIPFSYYVFNADNVGCGGVAYGSDTYSATPYTTAYFQLYENGGMGGVEGYAYVPFQYYGNFTSTQMLVQLANALTSASAASLNSLTYRCGFDTTTQQFWVNNGSTSVVFVFIFGTVTNSGNLNPRLWLGFAPGQINSAFNGPYPGDSAASGTALIVAPNAASLTGPNYLYVNSLKLGQLCNLYLPKGAVNLGGGNAGPQIAKIPVNVQPGGVVFWSDPDPFKYFNLETLDSLTEVDFYLTLGNTTTQVPLKLNGVGFSLKLALLLKGDTASDSSTSTAQGSRVVKRIRQQ